MTDQNENETLGQQTEAIENTKINKEYKLQLVWRNIILMILLHIGAVYGVICAVTDAKYTTILYTSIMGLFSAFGINVGVHRLWCHRSYKAKLPLQLILAFFNTMALQNDIYEWSRDHRVHHKYSEQDADPHDARRGFFFSHVGWLLCKKRPEVTEMGKTIFLDDLKADPLVQFQRDYYIPLIILIWGFIPAAIPHYLWGETWTNAIFICIFFRYVLVLNFTWLVNSASHMWGMKPYDKQINPVECYVRHLQIGEGFHNFHHTFAWDYSASEYGYQYVFNPATLVIDMFAKIGWAYDLKKVPELTLRKKMIKSGDINFKPNFSPITEWVFGFLSLFSPFLIILTLKILYQAKTSSIIY